jgi:uncharacterized DUF497 family protein
VKVVASLRVQQKLKAKHKVTLDEVYECLQNRTGGFLEDTRTEHQTVPPTLWCVAATNDGRLIKVVFVELPDFVYEIKTAYEPNADEVRIYVKYS